MRAKERISTFLDEIKNLWKNNFPDWRFGQLIENFKRWYGQDIFFLEENDFMEEFKKFTEEMKPRSLEEYKESIEEAMERLQRELEEENLQKEIEDSQCEDEAEDNSYYYERHCMVMLLNGRVELRRVIYNEVDRPVDMTADAEKIWLSEACSLKYYERIFKEAMNNNLVYLLYDDNGREIIKDTGIKYKKYIKL